jgi:hypothetical protein
MLFPSECIVTRKRTGAGFDEFTGIGIVFSMAQAREFFNYCSQYACYVIDETMPMRIESVANLVEAEKFYGKTLSV